MRGSEGLTQGTGVEHIYALVRQGLQTLVTLAVSRHRNSVQHLLHFFCIGNQSNLTFVYYDIKLIHDHCVEHFCKMGQTQTLLISFLANTHTDLISLAGVHHTFHVVEPGVNLTLDNGFEVRLHLSTVHFHICSQCMSLSCFQAVNICTNDGNLVVFYFCLRLSLNDLTGGSFVRAELNLHVALTDDFSLECICKCYRDRQFFYFDLNAAKL